MEARAGTWYLLPSADWLVLLENYGNALARFALLAKVSLPIDQITSENAAEFAAHRRARGAQVSTANSSLRVLRRALKLACEWGLLATPPKIKLLPGERHREFVLSQREEGLYLASAREPLASVASVLAETGLRPEARRAAAVFP